MHLAQRARVVYNSVFTFIVGHGFVSRIEIAVFLSVQVFVMLCLCFPHDGHICVSSTSCTHILVHARSGIVFKMLQPLITLIACCLSLVLQRNGEVVLSPEAFALVQDRGLSGLRRDRGCFQLLSIPAHIAINTLGLQELWQQAHRHRHHPSESEKPSSNDGVSGQPNAATPFLPRPTLTPRLPSKALLACFRSYIPTAAWPQIQAGQRLMMAEFRFLTILFMMLPDHDFQHPRTRADSLGYGFVCGVECMAYYGVSCMICEV